MICGTGLSSGDFPAPVAQPSHDINGPAQRCHVGPHDVDAGNLPVLDLGNAGLRRAEGTGKLDLPHPHSGTHFRQLMTAYVGLIASLAA
jgi:hypothetical protein